MKGRSLHAVGLFAFVAACSGGETSSPVSAKPPIEQVPANTPVPFAEKKTNDCESTWDAAALAESATAPFDAIDIQLDETPTFAITQGMYGTRTFTRMPAFTLYRDGTVIYPERVERPEKYLTATLTRAEADDLKARVLALGAEQLRSHVSSCTCPEDGPHGKVMICVSDASYNILRFRDRNDVLRHVVVYSGFWNRPLVASQIDELLEKFRAPTEALYVPDHATLVLEQNENDPRCTGSLPADLAKLAPAKGFFLAAIAVDGATLRTVQTIAPASGGRATWCNAPTTLRAYLYPWLPHADHRAAITATMQEMKPTE